MKNTKKASNKLPVPGKVRTFMAVRRIFLLHR